MTITKIINNINFIQRGVADVRVNNVKKYLKCINKNIQLFITQSNNKN